MQGSGFGSQSPPKKIDFFLNDQKQIDKQHQIQLCIQHH